MISKFYSNDIGGAKTVLSDNELYPIRILAIRPISIAVKKISENRNRQN
jgi:hypothetical protein